MVVTVTSRGNQSVAASPRDADLAELNVSSQLFHREVQSRLQQVQTQSPYAKPSGVNPCHALIE
jgi:hypothetical protein